MPGEADRLKKELVEIRGQHRWVEESHRMQHRKGEARIKELEEENEELEGLLRESVTDTQRLLDAGRANLNTNLMLQKQVAELEAKVEEQEVARLKKEIEELREWNEELERTVGILNGQSENKSEKIGWDAATIKDLHRQIRELREGYAGERAKLQEHIEENDNLQRLFSAERALRREVEAENKELTKENLRLIQEQMGVLAPSVVVPEDERGLGRVGGENWEMTRIMVRHAARLTDLEGRMNEVSAAHDLDPTLQRVEQLERKVGDVEGLARSVEGDLAHLAGRFSVIADRLPREIAALKGRLDEVATAYDSWDLMRDNQEARIGALEEEARKRESERVFRAGPTSGDGLRMLVEGLEKNSLRRKNQLLTDRVEWLENGRRWWQR